MRSQLQVFTYEDVDPENKGLLKHRNKRWPAGIYFLELTMETPEQCVKYVQS